MTVLTTSLTICLASDISPTSSNSWSRRGIFRQIEKQLSLNNRVELRGNIMLAATDTWWKTHCHHLNISSSSYFDFDFGNFEGMRQFFPLKATADHLLRLRESATTWDQFFLCWHVPSLCWWCKLFVMRQDVGDSSSRQSGARRGARVEEAGGAEMRSVIYHHNVICSQWHVIHTFDWSLTNNTHHIPAPAIRAKIDFLLSLTFLPHPLSSYESECLRCNKMTDACIATYYLLSQG